MGWRSLFNYWTLHHREGRPPSRKDIDPVVDIPKLLPNLMLIEPVEDRFLMRLVGSAIVRQTGIDVTGRIVEPAQLPGPDIADFEGFLRQVKTTATPLLYHVRHHANYTRGATGILLPLIDRNGDFEMVLGGFFFYADDPRESDDKWEPGLLRVLDLEDELARQ